MTSKPVRTPKFAGTALLTFHYPPPKIPLPRLGKASVCELDRRMAIPSLAIAKASLAASFLRPDPSVILREQVASFHNLIELTLQQCSPINVEV